jgi:predicted nucleotidyltransferase
MIFKNTRMVEDIVQHFCPVKVILFGSYAWGTPRKDSDVDLLVIMESDQRPAHRSAEISLACRPRGLPVGFLVKTPAEIAHRLKIGDPFLKRILEKGTVLYAR